MSIHLFENFSVCSFARDALSPFVRYRIGSSHQLKDGLSEGRRVHTKDTNVLSKVEKYIRTHRLDYKGR